LKHFVEASCFAHAVDIPAASIERNRATVLNPFDKVQVIKPVAGIWRLPGSEWPKLHRFRPALAGLLKLDFPVSADGGKERGTPAPSQEA
jgi:hypothetical protein